MSTRRRHTSTAEKEKMEAQANPNELNFAERLAAQKGRAVRNRMASARVTKDELVALEQAAKRQGLLLGEWAREVLLREAAPSKADPLWTEIVANRMLLLAVLRPLAIGQTMTAQRFDELVAAIKAGKRSMAQDVMAQYKAALPQEQNDGN